MHEWKEAFTLCLLTEKERKSYSYRDLDKLTGIAYALINHYGLKKKTPTLLNALKIAHVLNISFDRIIEKGTDYYKE